MSSRLNINDQLCNTDSLPQSPTHSHSFHYQQLVYKEHSSLQYCLTSGSIHLRSKFLSLAERYDAADFYMDILDESLVITHKMMLHEHLNNGNRKLDGRLERFTNVEPKPEEISLPQADIYCSVIRFQDMLFAMGCVDRGAVWRVQNSHTLTSV